MYDAYISTLLQTDSLQEAITFLDTTGTKVIHINGLSLHDFFADKYKRAYVLEVGADKNLITQIESDFMVMTNFPINQFAGKPLDQINGVGADRYKAAYQYIQANKEHFAFDNGIETLKRTIQSAGDFKTQVSLLFNPINNEIYVILKRNFNKVWKVSLNEETIETYSGFDQFKKIALNSEGISGTELQNRTSAINGENLKPSIFKLEQNYPNPFNPITNFEFRTLGFGFVSLKVFNILGNEVAVLVNEKKPAGEYRISFDATKYNLTSGVYLYRLEAGKFTDTKKFVLLK
ncbi:MAG TPA: T9SS type A sorting domain-containing protein [Ignavibacteriaceae bacterium]|nr:T9SS type A sorting domain-containing protein [Ignavibacteriaceae bacterium]